MESVDPKNQRITMAVLHEEEDNHIPQDKRKKQGAEWRQTSEPEKAHLTREFVIVAKFGDRVLRGLASSLSNVIRHAGRQADKNSSLGDFFRIQCLAFGYSLVVLNAIFCLGGAKTIQWACFSSLTIFLGWFLWAAVLGARATFGWIPTKQYYRTVWYTAKESWVQQLLA